MFKSKEPLSRWLEPQIFQKYKGKYLVIFGQFGYFYSPLIYGPYTERGANQVFKRMIKDNAKFATIIKIVDHYEKATDDE